MPERPMQRGAVYYFRAKIPATYGKLSVPSSV